MKNKGLKILVLKIKISICLKLSITSIKNKITSKRANRIYEISIIDKYKFFKELKMHFQENGMT